MSLARLAQVAGGAKRPADAIGFLVEEARKGFDDGSERDLDEHERALLAKSLKTVVNPQRKAVQTLHFECLELEVSSGGAPAVVVEYRDCKMEQLKKLCLQVVRFLEEVLLPMATSAESRVFLRKLAGDHMRYLCELPLVSQKDFKEWMDRGEEFYTTGFEESQSDLSPTDPVRLGLILNFAIFYHDIQQDVGRALKFAQEAYDDAAAELGVDPSTLETSNTTSSSSSSAKEHSIKGDLRSELSTHSPNGGQQEPDATRVLKIIRSSIKEWTHETQIQTWNE